MHFLPQEEARIREIVAGIEAKTGTQVVAAVVGKSDVYPEAPWKAFALAASVSTFVLAIRAMLDPPWLGPFDAAFAAAIVLGIGVIAALLTTFVPDFARLKILRARF